MLYPAACRALIQLNQWLSNHHDWEISALQEDRTFPQGPYETIGGECLTAAQAVARFWTSLEGARNAAFASWLLEKEPASQKDPLSLGELAIAAHRPRTGHEAKDNATESKETLQGLPDFKATCENLIARLTPEQRAQSQRAMVAALHRNLQYDLDHNQVRTLRQWPPILSQWMCGTTSGAAPELPGLRSWDADDGTPPLGLATSRVLAGLVQYCSDASPFHFAVRSGWGSKTQPGLLGNPEALDPIHLKSLRQAWEDLAFRTLGGMEPRDGDNKYPSMLERNGMRALLGINAVNTLLMTSSPEEHPTQLLTLVPLMDAYDHHVGLLGEIFNAWVGLNRNSDQSLLACLQARSERVRSGLRAQTIQEGMPEVTTPRKPGPRF